MRNKKKVLIVGTSCKTRGGITTVINSHKEGDQWQNFHCCWVETHIDRGILGKLFYFICGFIKYIFLLPVYDLVHIHTSEPPSVLRKCVFIFVAKLLQKKIIVHFHAFSVETTINSKYRGLYNYLFNSADCVIVLSEYWKREVDKTFNLGSKLQVLYNPCNVPVLQKKYKKKKIVLFAGTVNARKGYMELIQAFAKIADKYNDWVLVFAGNGDLKIGLEAAKSLKIEKQVVFLGWVDGEEKDKAFQEASIFCLPSHAEGFPMGVLDAWGYGLPVICTPVGGLPDIVDNGINALVFPVGNVDMLSMHLDKLMSDELLREKITQASISLSVTVFNRDNINKQLSNIYCKLLSN